MKTVDPGQILICCQKSTSRVLNGHVNPFARNLHVHCYSNLLSLLEFAEIFMKTCTRNCGRKQQKMRPKVRKESEL